MYFCSWRGKVGRCVTQQSAGCSHDNTLFSHVISEWEVIWWLMQRHAKLCDSVLESYFLRWRLLIPHCTSLKQEPGVRCGMFSNLSEQMNTTNECCFTIWICQALEEKKIKAMHAIYQNKCSRAKRIFEESLCLRNLIFTECDTIQGIFCIYSHFIKMMQCYIWIHLT